MTPRTIVVAGGLAQRAGYGGHAWVFLHYLLGLRRLGFDVLFVDRLEPDWCTDEGGESIAEQSRRLAYLQETMRAFGRPIPYAVLYDGGRRVLGMERNELAAKLRGSVMLLDVMGFLGDDELLDAAPLRVFVDIDPGFPQMWRALGWADVLSRHDAYVTVGANIGRRDCRIPTCGIDWLTTRPPVVLEHWPVQAGAGRAITTVAAWRGPFARIEYEGETYGLRAHEFRQFASLPRRTDASFELALDIDPADRRDHELLVGQGWALAQPRAVADGVTNYRSYVQQSSAELMIAKGMYVKTRSGWFSDRSASYLAASRPVITQDTAFDKHLPTGKGLFKFLTMDDILAAVDAIETDYAGNCAAAREIADQYFGAERVVGKLMQQAGL